MKSPARRTIGTLLFALGIWLLLTGEYTLAKTYKIGVMPWTGSSVLNIADAKGFWKKNGVSVKVITFSRPQEMESAMEKGLLDIRYDMLGSTVRLIMEGKPYVVIAETDWSNGGDQIILKRDIAVTGLMGKPVGVYMNEPAITYFLGKFFDGAGLTLSDVKIIGMPDEKLAEKFNAGLFPAMVHYGPYAMLAERDGNGRVVATSATYPGCIPEGLLMKKSVLRVTPREDLVAIFKGYIEALNWLKAPGSWPEYKTILNTHTYKGAPPFEEKDLKEMFDAVAIHDVAALADRNRTDGGLFAYLRDIQAFMKKNNLLKKEIPPEDIFDGALLMEALSGH